MQPHNDDDDDDEVNEPPALAAIQFLVRDFPRARQKEAARRIYELLREEYGNAGPPTPDWLTSLKERVETEFR